MNIFLHTLGDLGVKTTFVENNDIDGFVKATTPKTKLWYVETIGNPLVDVADVPAIVEAANSLPSPVPVFVDNTFATPYIYRPAEDGAAVVIESSPSGSAATARPWAAPSSTRASSTGSRTPTSGARLPSPTPPTTASSSRTRPRGAVRNPRPRQQAA